MKKLSNTFVDMANVENGGEWFCEGATVAGMKTVRVARRFTGEYTIAEIEAVLADMRSVQAVIDRPVEM